MQEQELESVKKSLSEMNITYKEGDVPDNLIELTKAFGYTVSPILVDLTTVDTVDAELGIIVQKNDSTVDNGVYIFTVLHSGQAGFIVVEPSTISRAPMIRNVSNDMTSRITEMDLPPLMPFDLVEIASHVITNTFMDIIMASFNIPEEYKQEFLRLYMPKFLANVGMYFVGAVKDDGTPMIYEEVVNIEPVIVWRSIQKGAEKEYEGGNAGKSGEREESGSKK